MSIILELKNISKTYKNEESRIPALKDVNLEIEEGTFNIIIGPSGCGKSTILRIIADLIKPTSGEIIWNKPMKFAFIFQHFALFPFMTVRENIEFGLKMFGMKSNNRNRIVNQLIEEMDLKDFTDKHPKELSGGMKQRVGIARALAVQPDMLLMDEPFSSLDELTAETLRKELLEICATRQITTIMVTHLISEAVKLSDRIFVMSQRPGTIIKDYKNDLPKPREERSKIFYDLEDRLKESLS